MKYLKHFDDRSEYDNYIGGDSVYLPNVSLVNGEEHSLFKNSEGVERIVRPTVHYTKFQPPIVGPGWVCYFDGEHIKLCKKEDYSSIEGDKYPIGAVVVPSDHLNDGTVRICALSNLSGTKKWASVSGYGINELTNMSYVPTFPNTEGSTTTGWTSYSYLPSDIGGAGWTGATCVHDTGTTYHSAATSYIPSQYNTDGTKNTLHSETHGNPDNNALNDFNGLENTTILKNLSGVAHEYTTGSTTTSATIDYIAAVECFNYHQANDNGIQWYLPACGELVYVVPRRSVIQSALSAIGGSAFTSSSYWSSSEYSGANARNVGLYNGNVYGGGKSNAGYVRAFAKVVLSPFCFV